MNSNVTFHTPDEAARLLGVSRGAVSRAIRTHQLRAVRRREGLRIPSTELARVLRGGAA
ncbi:helix-turn-helix domain-containing protein [Amycolatopsis dendrobii]|uniref:Helix-turn-helix domain-containing protein n=1 Tax=Amycolatopsis dendrobii TaxID=2760662 RepID=A0A7W3ZE34_9PSEU|nr:helix-turn-helix domain-containing protein [Amycolatopsis dendrobii]MBB1158085.1 helix-turn-helix domain-containing protein [Amycolatopsis dendrobii]